MIGLVILLSFVLDVAGKLKYAKELVVANLILFAIGISMFARLPAIGLTDH